MITDNQMKQIQYIMNTNNQMKQINYMIEEDFEDNFNTKDYKIYEDMEDSMQEFESNFEERYNSQLEYFDTQELKQYCGFNTTMEICKYVTEKYDEYDMKIECNTFTEDKILKAYVYFYLEEECKQNHINDIEEYYKEKM